MKNLLPPILALAFLVSTAGTAANVAIPLAEPPVVNREYVHGDESFVYAVYAVPELGVRETVLAMLSEEGIDTAKAERIIHCESSWRPTATNYNRDGSNDAGLWQINSVHGLSVEDRMDVEKSTRFAIKLIKTQGFNPWVCNNL